MIFFKKKYFSSKLSIDIVIKLLKNLLYENNKIMFSIGAASFQQFS